MEWEWSAINIFFFVMAILIPLYIGVCVSAALLSMK